MATETVNHADAERIGQAAQTLPDSEWAHHLAYQLTHIACQARAARALLREHPEAEANEDLTGVMYLLTSMMKDVEQLSNGVSEQAQRLWIMEASHG